jgi:hypothetical protein
MSRGTAAAVLAVKVSCFQYVMKNLPLRGPPGLCGAMLWAVPSYPCRGLGALPGAGGPAARGRPGRARLADGLCPARRRAPGTVSDLRAAPGMRWGHSAGRGATTRAVGRARRMRSPPQWRPARGGSVAGQPRGVVSGPLGTSRGSPSAKDPPAVAVAWCVGWANRPDDGDCAWHKLHSARGPLWSAPSVGGSPTRS